MKALILSDIHANIHGLEVIWEREKDSDIIYCAGDLVDYGPFPKEVLLWVRSHDVICVQGNHDQKVVEYYDAAKTCQVTDEDWTWAHDNSAKLNDEDIEFLRQLPQSVQFEMDGFSYSMQHLYENYNFITNQHAFDLFWEHQTVQTIRNNEQRRLIFGHTHRQGIYYVGNPDLWLNPGSVSYRRKDDPEKAAQYITITDGVIEMKSVTYDFAPLWTVSQSAKVKPSEMEAAKRFFCTSAPSQARHN